MNVLRSHTVLWFLVVLTVTLLVFAANKMLNQQVSTYVKGKQIYQDYGCGVCHGDAGAGPIRRSSLKTAPDLFNQWIEAKDIIENIQLGSYEENFAIASRFNTDRLKMPPYQLYLNKVEINALVVYLQSHQIINDQDIPKNKGMKIAMNSGCFGCHGPLGLGGAVNPKSVKNSIPGWFGEDFDALTDNGNPDSVKEWIKQGTSRAVTEKSFGLGKIAHWFLSRQAIKMPEFDQRLDDEEIQELLTLILTIREMGDFKLEELVEFKNQLLALPVEKVKTEKVQALEEELLLLDLSSD